MIAEVKLLKFTTIYEKLLILQVGSTMKKLVWDDQITEDLKQIWASNFEMIEEIESIRFKRAVVPEDVINLNFETLDFADASQSMICFAIYARFKRKSGGHSCQLLFARSKIVQKDVYAAGRTSSCVIKCRNGACCENCPWRQTFEVLEAI